MALIDRVYVDFNRTFGQGVFLGVEPKMVRKDKNDRNSPMEQGRDKDGVRKWAVAVAVKIKNFEQAKNETLSVTLTSETQPCSDLSMGEVVKVEGLEMGVMKNERGGFTT